MTIYYDSQTGNVARFIEKIRTIRPHWTFQKISPEAQIKDLGHLITFTTKIGEVPQSTECFLLYHENHQRILSVSSSGNRNWGIHYAVAGDIISDKFGMPCLLKFELSGTNRDVHEYIKKTETFYASKELDLSQ